MVLPAMESMPILLLRFTSSAPKDLRTFVKERFEECGLCVNSEEECEDGSVILGLTATQEELEEEAEHCRLVKPAAVAFSDTTTTTTTRRSADTTSNDDGDEDEDAFILEYFTVQTKSAFTDGVRMDRSVSARSGGVTEYDADGLFTSSDRVLLTWSILNSIYVLGPGSTSSNLSRTLDRMNIHYLLSRNRHTHHDTTTTSTATTRLLPSRVLSSEQQTSHISHTLRHVLQEHDLVDLVTPVHIPHIRDNLCKEIMTCSTTLPLQGLRDYYGEEVAYYFAWMESYTQWLILPALSGIVISAARWYRGDTVDNCELTPFHGLITFVWAILFLRFWNRREAMLAYRWGTYSSTGYDRKFYSVRPEFKGELRTSRVTGLPEEYYPPRTRRLKYCASALVTIVLLGCAFHVMILSLNLQGYVGSKKDRILWGERSYEHPFHYPFLSVLAEEGNWFDATSHWKCFLPVILHVIVVTIMNMGYSKVAQWLTEWENHETEVAHENSLIVKRFLFAAFDAYLVLFFLAFFERDVGKLRSELVNVFTIDTFRRLLLECILPMALQRFQGSSGVTKGRKKDDKKLDDLGLKEYTPLKDEVGKIEYEQFDDYLEMIIQLGYVTLFASAFPLASTVAIFANWIEVRTDVMKLTKVCLRPHSIRTDNIGTWKMLIKTIVWWSALTNCCIFAYTSKQMSQYFPEFFYMDEPSGTQRVHPTKGYIIVCLVFAMERFLLLMALFVNAIIPDVPEDVRILEARRQFVRFQENRKLRANKKLVSETTGSVRNDETSNVREAS